jgi:hypothetical protein
MKGALGMEHPSLKRLHGSGLRGVPSLGTLENMLGKPLDVGISLHGGPLPSGGNLVCGGKAHIPGNLVMGHLSARDTMKGTVREDCFTGKPLWGRGGDVNCNLSCNCTMAFTVN